MEREEGEKNEKFIKPEFRKHESFYEDDPGTQTEYYCYNCGLDLDRIEVKDVIYFTPEIPNLDLPKDILICKGCLDCFCCVCGNQPKDMRIDCEDDPLYTKQEKTYCKKHIL